MTEDKQGQVEVARISARTAIIVALITAMSGLITGYLVNKPSEQPKQRWLVIHSVSSDVATDLKLVARVNSIPYSYPADALMTRIAPGMPKQRCPLPLADDYAVSFEAFFREDGDEASDLFEAKNRETHQISGKQPPKEEQKYGLHEVVGGEKKRYDVLTVTYSIE